MNKDADIYPVIEGFCPICVSPLFNIKGDPLDSATQFDIVISGNKTTSIGLCVNCYKDITMKQVRAIFKGIKEYWERKGYTGQKLANVHKMLKHTNKKMLEIE